MEKKSKYKHGTYNLHSYSISFSHDLGHLFAAHFKLVVFCSKWKGDKTSVHSIQVSPEGDSLLSAGRDIRLWDLDKKEVLKVSILSKTT